MAAAPQEGGTTIKEGEGKQHHPQGRGRKTAPQKRRRRKQHHAPEGGRKQAAPKRRRVEKPAPHKRRKQAQNSTTHSSTAHEWRGRENSATHEEEDEPPLYTNLFYITLVLFNLVWVNYIWLHCFIYCHIKLLAAPPRGGGGRQHRPNRMRMWTQHHPQWRWSIHFT